MKQRIITAIILCVVLIPLVVLGDYFMLGLSLLLAYGAGYELLNMFSKKDPSFRKVRFIYPLFSCLIVATNFCVVKHVEDIDMTFLFFEILFITVFTFIYCLINPKMKMSSIGKFLITLFYSGIFVAGTTSLRYVSTINTVTDAKYLGLFILIYLCVTTMSTDIFAHMFGTPFGKHKMAPLISPNKSWEGAIAGSVFGTVLGTITLVLIEHFYQYTLFGINNMFLNILVIFIFTLATTIVGQMGDLIASKFKREYEIKDYSNIFPGHGGILDRFDSILLTGTFMYLVFLLLGIM